jgi:hypothetical protein
LIAVKVKMKSQIRSVEVDLRASSETAPKAIHNRIFDRSRRELRVVQVWIDPNHIHR